jgi:hypothetical protein
MMARRTSPTKDERRTPMGIAAHDSERRSRGRTTSSRTPLFVRNATADEELDREWLQQRMGFRLGKFATGIDRADVTVRDEGGPKGAPTIRATVRLQLPNQEPIAVTAYGATARIAVAAALQSCERTLRRTLGRRVAKRKLAAGRAAASLV